MYAFVLFGWVCSALFCFACLCVCVFVRCLVLFPRLFPLLAFFSFSFLILRRMGLSCHNVGPCYWFCLPFAGLVPCCVRKRTTENESCRPRPRASLLPLHCAPLRSTPVHSSPLRSFDKCPHFVHATATITSPVPAVCWV